MYVPVPCQPIAQQLAGLKNARAQLQQELRTAPSNTKALILSQIRDLNSDIHDAEDALSECVAQQPPPSPPLVSTLVGRLTMSTTNSNAPGPYPKDVGIGVTFNAARTDITVTNFPSISQTFHTPLGDNTTTVTLAAGGIGSYASGVIHLPLALHFHESLRPFGIDQDSDLNIVMSTDGPAGVPMDAAGNVTLAGSGTFVNGFLNKDAGTFTLDGSFSPVP